MSSLKLRGIAASPGYAIAKIVKYDARNVIPERKQIADCTVEQQKLREAIAQAKVELEAIREHTEQQMGAEKAEIFEGHLMLLEDPDLIDVTFDKIATESINADFALHEVAAEFIAILEDMDNELLRERAVDIRDVTNRVIGHLLGHPTQNLAVLTEPCIIVAHDLTPSETAQLNVAMVQAFVTEVGSRTSHSAIMARSLDIPAIVGLGEALRDVADGATIIVDAMEGTIVVEPSASEQSTYTERKQHYQANKQRLLTLRDEPTRSADGVHVELAANIGNVEDVHKALENGAEAIGLFRTEFLYMGRQDFPSEEEQFTTYKTVLQKMNGKPVVIRTLDIGGDKELAYLELPKESNPFLGQRALRLCLENEPLFRTQIRALLRASVYGNLKVMFPMVATMSELVAAKQIWREEQRKLEKEGISFQADIEIGIMIEIPAAAIMADLFAQEVDFFSIGTNDLIQYTMAADRMNENVAYLYQPCHPAILRLVNMVIRGAERAGKWVGMCGEMAGDERAVPLLLGLGLHEFSMSASAILVNRERISTLHQAHWRAIAERCLQFRSQEEVLHYVEQQLKGMN